MEVKRAYRVLVVATTCLALSVIVIGAYVRLTGAGLGCPDWPGCYGKVSPAHAVEEIARAVNAQGGEQGPVSLHKAWNEMLHRYLAGALGLAILAIAIAAWTKRAALAQSPLLPASLLLLVIFQAALGMWTVTLLLKPAIVVLHLLGGMATLALLVWLSLRQAEPVVRGYEADYPRLRQWAAAGLAIVIVQIALGGWVASNYAALACIDLPTCHGKWLPQMDFAHGFQLTRELGRTAAGGPLAYDALTAIHWSHRLGALITLLLTGALAVGLVRARRWRRHGIVLAVVLTAQIVLGIANILAGLPLGIAVAHNAGSAILLAYLVMLNFKLSRPPRSTPTDAF